MVDNYVNDVGSGQGALINILLIGLTISLVLYVILAFSLYKIFKKTNENGIKAIIPIVNVCTLMKIVGMNPVCVLLFLIPGINLFILALLDVRVANRFGKGAGFALGLLFLPFIFYPLLAFTIDLKQIKQVETEKDKLSSPLEQDSISCPVCGTQLAKDATTCFVCGESISKINKNKSSLDQTIKETEKSPRENLNSSFDPVNMDEELTTSITKEETSPQDESSILSFELPINQESKKEQDFSFEKFIGDEKEEYKMPFQIEMDEDLDKDTRSYNIHSYLQDRVPKREEEQNLDIIDKKESNRERFDSEFDDPFEEPFDEFSYNEKLEEEPIQKPVRTLDEILKINSTLYAAKRQAAEKREEIKEENLERETDELLKKIEQLNSKVDQSHIDVLEDDSFKNI